MSEFNESMEDQAEKSPEIAVQEQNQRLMTNMEELSKEIPSEPTNEKVKDKLSSLDKFIEEHEELIKAVIAPVVGAAGGAFASQGSVEGAAIGALGTTTFYIIERLLGKHLQLKKEKANQ